MHPGGSAGIGYIIDRIIRQNDLTRYMVVVHYM